MLAGLSSDLTKLFQCDWLTIPCLSINACAAVRASSNGRNGIRCAGRDDSFAGPTPIQNLRPPQSCGYDDRGFEGMFSGRSAHCSNYRYEVNFIDATMSRASSNGSHVFFKAIRAYLHWISCVETGAAAPRESDDTSRKLDHSESPESSGFRL